MTRLPAFPGVGEGGPVFRKGAWWAKTSIAMRGGGDRVATRTWWGTVDTTPPLERIAHHELLQLELGEGGLNLGRGSIEE